MSEPTIQPGAKVVLKSGGPRMTVGIVTGDKLTCQWFDCNEVLQTADFPAASVTVYES